MQLLSHMFLSFMVRTSPVIGHPTPISPTHCQVKPGQVKLAAPNSIEPSTPNKLNLFFFFQPQKRVLHDLIIVHDWQETKWRPIAKEDHAKIVYKRTESWVRLQKTALAQQARARRVRNKGDNEYYA